MKLKYCKRRKTYELAGSDTKFANMENFIVYHNGQKYYVPLVSPTDANASKLRVVRKGNVLAPLRYFDEAIDMLNGRTLADVQQIFRSGLGKYYFKAGDYFDITIPKYLWLRNGGSIAANSTWRVVCLGIDHNADIEGYNRGHFCIGRTTNNVEIAFYAWEMNVDNNNTNAGGWEATNMRSWLNSSFYNILPSDLQAVITPCDKYTDNVGGVLPSGANVDANMTITSDKIWIMSAYEVRGVSNGVNHAEDTKLKWYDYYRNGNPELRLNHNNLSSVCTYFVRSAMNYNNTGFLACKGENAWGSANSKTNYGFVPCFTIS